MTALRPGAGATPPGARSEQEASEWVRRMFGEVAPRYDLLNRVLSFNVDQYWRARTVSALQPWLRRPGARVLDLCCGTGDLLLALSKRREASAMVLGSDFCHPMLTEAARKSDRARLRAPLFEADALSLPVRDASLDAVTVAFGFRNLTSYRGGLEELRRVLRPGGVAAILEFSTPPNRVFARLYDWYSLQVLPRVGALVSGSGEAYRYLPESVRKFPSAEPLAEEMRTAGFRNVTFRRMTFGIVALHLGET